MKPQTYYTIDTIVAAVRLVNAEMNWYDVEEFIEKLKDKLNEI